MYKPDLVLNILQWLICIQTKPNHKQTKEANCIATQITNMRLAMFSGKNQMHK